LKQAREGATGIDRKKKNEKKGGERGQDIRRATTQKDRNIEGLKRGKGCGPV